MVDVLGLLALVVLVALFVFLFTRSLRVKNTGVKWIGAILSGLLALVSLAALIFGVIGTYKLSVPAYRYSPVEEVSVPADPELIARGEKMALLCADCHSSRGGGNLPLDGGENFLAGGPPMGVVRPVNLTPGGELKDWSDGDIIRAIREGVHKSGRPLVVMPSIAWNIMADEDVHALVAYLRSQPAVEDTGPKNKLNVLGAIMTGAGMIPPEIIMAQPPVTGPVAKPPAGTKEHGDYLLRVMGCRDCHGFDLSGTGLTGTMAPNLTILVPAMSEEQFLTTIQTGVDPSGHELNPEEMPWKGYSQALSDGDLKDIYTYLKDVTPVTQSGATP